VKADTFVCQPAHMRWDFIRWLLRRTSEDERRWDDILASIGTIEAEGHEWDSDPAAWVHAQRYGDEHRVG
jgi:hypothetical protein